MALLEAGVDILKWNASLQNNPKNRALVHAAKRLLTNAQQSQQSNPEPSSFSFSPLWQDFVNTSNLGFELPTTGLEGIDWHAQTHNQSQVPAGYTVEQPMQSDGIESFFASLLEPTQSPMYGGYGQYQQGM